MTRYFLIAPDRGDNMSIFNNVIEGTILTKEQFNELLCESDGRLYEYMCADPKTPNARLGVLEDWNFYCPMFTRSGEYYRREKMKKELTEALKKAGWI